MSDGFYELGGVKPVSAAAWIAPGAHVIGNVRLGARVGVWFNAVIRGDNEAIEVGEGTNIQDGAVLHTDPGFVLSIGRDCTIGHNAIVHGCVIGDGVLIGMGATIMNGAKIGAGSLVGANALIPEGKTFPERSLILGAPAKAVRALTDDEVARNLYAAENYRGRAEAYSAGLKPL